MNLNSLWIDECYTYLSTTGTQFRNYVAVPQNVILDHPPQLTDPAHAKPWWQVLRPDTQDIHPPTFYFLLRMWASVFGWSAVALRSFSVLISLIAIAVLFAVVRELSGTSSGLWAAAIMAVAQPQVDLARDARSYLFVVAISLATAWALLRIEKHGVNRGRLIGLAIGCFALPMTHYYAITVDFTLLAYAAMQLKGANRRAALTASGGAVILFFMLWGPVLYLQAHGVSGRGTFIFHDNEEQHFLQTFARLALLPVRFLYEPLPNMRIISMLLAAFYIIPFVLRRRRPDLLLWGLWLVINVLPSFLVDLTHHTFTLEIDRYNVFASVALYALIPSLCKNLAPLLRHVLPALVIAGCLVNVRDVYAPYGRTRQDWRTYTRDYRKLATPGCLTVFVANAEENDERYLCLEHYQSPLPGPAVLLSEPPSPAMSAIIQRYPRVIAVGLFAKADTYFPGSRIIDLKQVQHIGSIWRVQFPPVPSTRPRSKPQ